MALAELEILDQEGPDLQCSQGNVFPEDFIEDVILLSEVDDLFPVPLGIHKLAVFHIAAQRLLADGGEGSRSAIESSKERGGLVGEESDLDFLLIVHVVETQDGGGIVEGTQTKLEVLDVAG
jgi:hypothetical protein